MEKNKQEFQASLSTSDMREQANQIAREHGLTEPGEIDAFRHAYVSAKVSEKTNSFIADVLGRGNELKRELGERTNSVGNLFDLDPETKWKGNPTDEWEQDVANNRYGIQKEEELAKLKLKPEEKERRLRRELADAVRSGELKAKPDPSNRRYYDDVNVKNYSRDDGTKVKSHSRTAPDGDPTNNKVK